VGRGSVVEALATGFMGIPLNDASRDVAREDRRDGDAKLLAGVA